MQCVPRLRGRCTAGDQYVCTAGPVFRDDPIQRFLEAF
jgi:hypothetical protein